MSDGFSLRSAKGYNPNSLYNAALCISGEVHHDPLVFRAQRAAATRATWRDPSEPATSVALELAFVIEHLERWQQVYKIALQRLTLQENEAQTQLIRLHPVDPEYLPVGHALASRIRERFVRIEDERRRLSVLYEERTQPLRRQLLTLLIRLAVLDP